MLDNFYGLKGLTLVDGDAWVMLPSEAIEALYMDYGNVDIKSFEYQYNRLIIHI